MLTLAHLKPIQLSTDKPLFVQLRRILKLSLTPRFKKSPLISQQVYSQIEFQVHRRALAAPFGRDPTILRIAYLKRSPLLPQNERTLNYQYPHWPHITLVLPLLHFPAHQASSRRSREDGILASLAHIEVEVDTLYHRALNSLAHLGQPSPSVPPSSFPLADLFLLSKDLESRLEIIMFKGPSVLKVKDSNFLKLKTIHCKLLMVKISWNEELATIRAMKTPVYGLPCDTGKVLLS